MIDSSKPLRADVRRTVNIVLHAAEQVLRRDPTASLEQVATVAGVTRTTIHRRFASREALLAELSNIAVREFYEAFESASPETAPVMVALHRLTVNVMRVKAIWLYAMAHLSDDDPAVITKQRTLLGRLGKVFERAQREGYIAADVDLIWAQRMFRAMTDEAVAGITGTGMGAKAPPMPTGPDDLARLEAVVDDAELDRLTTLIMHTLFTGIGTHEPSI